MRKLMTSCIAKEGPLALLLLLFLSSCGFNEPMQLVQGRSMGTFYQVRFEANPRQTALIRQQIDLRLNSINQTFSTYVLDSEINRISQAEAGQWLPVSKDMLQVLAASQEVYQASGGAFDPSVRPLVDIWGFGPLQRPDRIPAEQEIAEAMAALGFDQLELDKDGQRIFLHRPLSLDLSGIAKGFAVDQIAQLLAAKGIDNYLVNIGGDMRLAGLRESGEPWRVAIESPEAAADHYYRLLHLSDQAIVSSGDYRNYFEDQGQRFSHTLDPVTGFPIANKLASITVLAPTAMMADAWATAFTVLGAQASLDLANELGIAIYTLERSGDEFVGQGNVFFEQQLFQVPL